MYLFTRYYTIKPSRHFKALLHVLYISHDFAIDKDKLSEINELTRTSYLNADIRARSYNGVYVSDMK